MSGKPDIEVAAARRADDLRRSIGREFATIREDAGLTRAAVARAAGVRPSTVGRMEVGLIEADFATMARVASVLGSEVSIRLFPAGAPIRDRFQAPMLEALQALMHRDWARSIEVPVVGSVRGVVDCVLGHPVEPLVLAIEVQSELRRPEATLRRSADKAAALPRSEAGHALAAARDVPQVDVSRLLILRSTVANRAVVRDLARTFAAAYPARAGDAVAALRDPRVGWPGPAIIWVHLHGRHATVMERPPRGVTVGR